MYLLPCFYVALPLGRSNPFRLRPMSAIRPFHISYMHEHFHSVKRLTPAHPSPSLHPLPLVRPSRRLPPPFEEGGRPRGRGGGEERRRRRTGEAPARGPRTDKRKGANEGKGKRKSARQKGRPQALLFSLSFLSLFPRRRAAGGGKREGGKGGGRRLEGRTKGRGWREGEG